jgi:hypothetical protein
LPPRGALLLNGRFNNVVYGSYAPGAQSGGKLLLTNHALLTNHSGVE